MLVFFAKDVVDFIERIDVRGLRHCTLLGQSRCVTARALATDIRHAAGNLFSTQMVDDLQPSPVS
ncbi:hypothetical protein MPL3365_230205 [Mesorhizobium plurifarium]|uniref:Uncharacterized protein n=1 Tax=Mesorhizobium plurifarium TaxID=69974 RepID=A0A090GUH2_MESPL|nr:hypothetical protein MPL3365_230205 [Mesorhizobium plurifarium]